MENSDDYLLQKKVEIMIDTHNKKVKSEFDSLKTELESIRSMINRLNNDISEIRKNIDNNGVNNNINNNAANRSEQVIIPDSQEKPKPKMHPRCGNYSSEDVSVNKFFYFGNKK